MLGGLRVSVDFSPILLLQDSAERSFTLHISYLEIYNEAGYDLLDPKHEAAKLEDLP